MPRRKGASHAQVYVRLKDMATRLNETLELEGASAIGERTPYDWYRRHKAGGMEPPMPEPVDPGRSPVFLMSQIKRWYVGWKGLE